MKCNSQNCARSSISVAESPRHHRRGFLFLGSIESLAQMLQPCARADLVRQLASRLYQMAEHMPARSHAQVEWIFDEAFEIRKTLEREFR